MCAGQHIDTKITHVIRHQFSWVQESNVQLGPLPGGSYRSGYFKQNLLKVSYMACLKRKYKNKYRKKFFQNPDDFKSPFLKKNKSNYKE